MKSQGKAQPDAARSLTHPEERMLIPEIAARNERLQRARKAGVPEVGLFFTAKERQKNIGVGWFKGGKSRSRKWFISVGWQSTLYRFFAGPPFY